jgi:membrane protease YdiL (CAAX protease family)
MTYEEQIKIEFTLNEKISNAILIFLLLVRLIDQDLAIWIFGANMPNWFPYWYAGIAYILTAAIIWLNRHRLAMLNIDRPFVGALILGGVLYAFYLTPDIGALVGITAGLIFWAYQKNQFVFKNPVPYPKGTGLLILLLMLLALVPVLLYAPTLKTPFNVQSIISTFLETMLAQLAVIVFEELIFRGALWTYLRSLGLNERATFSVQAFLFWVSHHKFLLLNNPYFFWIALPINAILLGLMTWRSKSLTLSTIGHFLFNFISQLLRIFF